MAKALSELIFGEKNNLIEVSWCQYTEDKIWQHRTIFWISVKISAGNLSIFSFSFSMSHLW